MPLRASARFRTHSVSYSHFVAPYLRGYCSVSLDLFTARRAPRPLSAYRVAPWLSAHALAHRLLLLYIHLRSCPSRGSLSSHPFLKRKSPIWTAPTPSICSSSPRLTPRPRAHATPLSTAVTGVNKTLAQHIRSSSPCTHPKLFCL